MRFTAYTALVASASAALHDACTMTWESAADPQCAGDDTLSCFDWQKADGSASTGLMCGPKASCGEQFNWTNPADNTTTMFLA